MQELVPLMKKTLADLFQHHLQLKQHHWHVSGAFFRDIHIMFDEATDVILGAIDDLGEKIVGLGYIAPTSLDTIQGISDLPAFDEREMGPEAMLKNALQATLHLIGEFKNMLRTANEIGEYGVEQLAGDLILKLEVIQYKYQQFLGIPLR